MPLSALGLAVFGLQPAATVLPIGPSGCVLLAQPDFLTLLLPQAGTLPVTLAIPSQPALVGQVLFHQGLSVELDATGAILSIGGSNGQALTIGGLW